MRLPFIALNHDNWKYIEANNIPVGNNSNSTYLC